MGMTVQELIDELMKVRDKSKRVLLKYKDCGIKAIEESDFSYVDLIETKE